MAREVKGTGYMIRDDAIIGCDVKDRLTALLYLLEKLYLRLPDNYWEN